MTKFARKIAFLLAVFILTAALGGCGGGKETKESPPPPGSTGTGTEETNSPAGDDMSSSKGPAYGGEITVGIAQDLDDSLDPHRMVTAGTREILFNIFEGLVKPTNDGNLVPAVASDYSISESGDTFTFTLREGIRFHNGDLVTVGDIVFSVSRCAGLDGGEPLISAFAAVESVRATDDKTVVIKTAEPNIEFLSYLTAGIIPEGYDPETDVIPAGTGPFRYLSRSPQENIIIEKFEDYWGDAAYLDKITFKIIENASTLIMSLQSGAIDFCAHLTTTQTAELGDAFNIIEGTMNLVQGVYLNHKFGPFSDPRVRQALSYAVDSQQIMDMIADGRGAAVGSSMYPAFKKYFMPELADYYACNQDKAKRLLEEAGYGDGLRFTITVPSNYTPHVDTAQVVVEQLKAVGVTAEISQIEWAAWISDVYQGRNFEATIVGVDASAMTARAMLERFVSDHNENFINFDNEEYDRVYAQAIASTDDGEQTKLYKKLQTILTEEAANIYIQDLCDLIAIKSNLDGFQFYPIYVLDMSGIHYVE